MRTFFEDLTGNDRQKYKSMAQRMIYPDLRSTYVEHAAMVACLARTLFDLEQMAQAGHVCNQEPGHKYVPTGVTKPSLWDDNK